MPYPFRSSFMGLLMLTIVAVPGGAIAKPDAYAELAQKVDEIDSNMPGKLGVYIKRLNNGGEINHKTDRPWYLASVIKIPLAVAVLQRVEAGELSLDQEVELAESDFVDGTGELLWADPGTTYTVDELIEHSIAHSDSTATDMLIRLIGEKSFNDQLAESAIVNGGFGYITTILQVRHDAYSEVHANAQQLDNLDFIDLKKASNYSERYRRLLEKMAIEPDEAGAKSLHEAFELYYDRGLNSGDLSAVGDLLERLIKGELLSPANTDRLLDYMEMVSTGDSRIKAGLPDDAVFAQKTGTQVGRACNVGVVNPRHLEEAVVVAACAEKFDYFAEAERAFAQLGKALKEAGLVR